MKKVAVFCGASAGPIAFGDLGRRFMRTCHSQGWGLVFGGGKVGMMGILADEMLALGGDVIGVIPEHLMKWEVGHTGVKDLRVVDSMHTRKQCIYDESDAFVAFPGGIGTLDELFEILTWKQLLHHSKPIVIFNPDGYFDGLMQWFARAMKDGYFAAKHRELFHVCSELEELNSYLQTVLA